MEYVPHPERSFMAKFDRYEPVIQDSTAMKQLKACDRKYFYRIVLGFVPLRQKYQLNLDWGNVRHKFMEILENTKGDLKAAMNAAYMIKLSEPEKGYEFLDKVRLTQMLAKDYEHWLKEKEQGRIKTLYVEQPINVELPDGNQVGGRVDKLILWSGQLWDLDWKTSSKTKEYFAKEKDPDDQSTRYIYILNKLHGSNTGGVLFNVMYNTKTVGPEIYTHTVSKTPLQLKQWEKEQIHLNKQLALNRSADIWPMREHNCKFCEYNWVCRQSNEAAQMAKLQAEYKVQPWDMEKTTQGGETE